MHSNPVPLGKVSLFLSHSPHHSISRSIVCAHNEKVNKKHEVMSFSLSIFLAYKRFCNMFCRLPKTWASNYFMLASTIHAHAHTHTWSFYGFTRLYMRFWSLKLVMSVYLHSYTQSLCHLLALFYIIWKIIFTLFTLAMEIAGALCDIYCYFFYTSITFGVINVL